MNIGCPYCKTTLECDESYNGTPVECPACGKTFEVRCKPDMEASKSDLGKWLVTSGEHAFFWMCRALQRFLKREPPVETNVSRFKNAASTFEFSRLFPLAIICLGWGWFASFFYGNTNLFVDSDSRWAIIPIAILALYGSVRAFRHFVRLKTMQWTLLVATCLFTATVGMLGLLLFQEYAAWVVESKAHGRVAAFVKLFGLLYHMAGDNPDTSLWEKFLGYIGGVGFCEEVTKLLPLCLLLFYRRKLPFKLDLSFRSFLMIGFFSGLGFGIGEALSDVCSVPLNPLYSAQIARWFACVPSHAVYTVVDAAFLWLFQTRISQAKTERGQFGWFALCVAVVAVLHGVYDVLSSVESMCVILDAASLVLMWWIVRFAVQRKPSFDGNADGFEDFEPSTVKTFGKSFAKIYLVVFIGILMYAVFFVKDLEKEVERRIAEISDPRKPFNVFDSIGSSHEPSEAPSRLEYTVSTSQASQRPPLYLQVANGDVDPPRIAGHAENPRTGLLHNPNGPLDPRAEFWNALVTYGKSGKRPHDPPTMYEQIMLGERNVPIVAGHHFDGATGKLYNPNGPLDMRAELWNAQIDKDTSEEAPHDSPTLYEQVLRGERNVPVFAGHHFDGKTGKLYNPNGPLDPRAEAWNSQIDESNRNAGR